MTGFSALLCGRAKRKAQEDLAMKRQALRDESGPHIQQQLQDEIAPERLAEHSVTKRVRDYPNTLTFWAFLSQVAGEDSSCARAVSRVQQWARDQDLPVPGPDTGAYCKARQQLPIEMLQAVNVSLCDQLDRQLPHDMLWRGFRVKAEDGTSAQAPDTPENRASYPYPSGQAEGCGFPVVRLVGQINLGHGGLRDFAHSNLQTGELRGHDELENYLEKGDVLVADRLFSSFEVIARASQREVHFIGRYHQARKMDFRKGRKVGPDERIQVWKKPRQQPKQSRLSAEEWVALPDELPLRIIRTRGPDRQGRQRTRYVITTLLDHESYPADEVASLYCHRWEIEVRFRDIKTTMGMEMLRTKSPEMIQKEVLMHMIVYNLMRLLMLKAGIVHEVNHRRLSFKGALQVLEESRGGFGKVAGRPRLRACEIANLWLRISERIVTDRPGRSEPRRVKRRPKCSRWLQRPRHAYFEHFRNENPPAKILDQVA